MGWKLALAAIALCALSACASAPQREPTRQGRLADIYRSGEMPDALPTCDRLAVQRAELEQQAAALGPARWSLREAQVRVLSFDEVYTNRRIHAALLETLNFDTYIPQEDGRPARHLYVRVPRGFVTDFSSIPPGLAQSIHRSFGKTAIPAIAHDFLYAVGIHGDSDGRWYADSALRRGMFDHDSGFFSRHTVFRSVRMFGAGSYGRAEELRFLNPRAEQEEQRIIIPITEWSESGGASAVRERYVRLCPPTADDLAQRRPLIVRPPA